MRYQHGSVLIQTSIDRSSPLVIKSFELPDYMNVFAVTFFLNRFLYYPVVLIFVLNLLQRRHMKEGTSKRHATLYIGIGLLSLWGYTFLAIRFALGDLYLIPVIIVLIGACILFRSRLFPFRLFCGSCGQRLHLREFLYVDSNLCASCDECRPLS